MSGLSQGVVVPEWGHIFPVKRVFFLNVKQHNNTLIPSRGSGLGARNRTKTISFGVVDGGRYKKGSTFNVQP